MPRADTARERPVRPVLLVATLALGTTALSLLQSIVVPVLPTIADQLGVSPTAAGWVLTANLLAAAVSTPVLGRLGDALGERPVLLGILATTCAGTLLALVTSSLPALIVARVLQGVSYGLFPLSISVLRRELTPGRLTVAMSVVSSTLAVGGVVGLVAAALLTRDGGDYHGPFWLGAAVSLAALALTAAVLPRRPPTGGGRVDWWGALVLGAGLVLLLLPVSQGNGWGWTSPATLGCLAGAVLVLAGWVVLQRRRAEPLVRPALLADPRTLVPTVAGLMTGVGLFASFLGLLAFVQSPPPDGFGASVVEAAVLYLLPGGVAGVLLAPVAGRVVARVGALPTLLSGAVSGIAGFGLFALARAEPWQVVTAGLLTQLWATVAYAALPALVVAAVRPEETGVANAVNSIARSVGQALGSAVTVALLAAGTDALTGRTAPEATTAVALVGVGAAAVVVLVAVLGLRGSRRRDLGTPETGATAAAGEWSPVSGVR
ncbi:MFS transporter [Geodermatophilus marinus]|uniref:MFS transporter n=1 Tax=Geodermatophilus sp. LHW52908 TaxID=2303986 RepID=UPI000E3BB0DC|nr:MFS transporter [Geodermatophilus sp. LHW52908]RFU23224.1 MFS transporter [Geodermatophilus sp. LHW52908]